MVKNRSIIIKRWIGWHFKTLKGKNTQILFTFLYKTIDEKPNTWSVFLIMWNHYESSAHRCPWWNRNWVTLVSRDVVIRLGHFLTPNFFVCLQLTLPWGTLSSLSHMSPTESDDGPIMWVRPGEQTIPVADVPKSPFKRKRWVSQSFLLHFCMKRPRNNFHKTDILVSAAAVYAGYKSWVLPALLSQRLVLFLAALKDWLWRAEKKKVAHLPFETAALVTVWSFVVVEHQRMKQLPFSLPVPLLLALRCCLQHEQVVSVSEAASESVRVFVMLAVCCSPLGWDHPHISRFFTWLPAKRGPHTFISCFLFIHQFSHKALCLLQP